MGSMPAPKELGGMLAEDSMERRGRRLIDLRNSHGYAEEDEGEESFCHIVSVITGCRVGY